MGQLLMPERRSSSTNDPGPAENSSNSGKVVRHETSQVSSPTSTEKMANQTVEVQATAAGLTLWQRTGRAQEAGTGKQRKALRTSVARGASAREESCAHVAGTQQAARNILHIRTAVRNRKRRWRLLAQHELLAASFKAAARRREGQPSNGQRRLPRRQRRSCVREGDDVRGPATDPSNCLERRASGTSCMSRLRSPLGLPSARAAVSSPPVRPAPLSPSRPSLSPRSHECSPPRVLRTASAAAEVSADTASAAVSPPVVAAAAEAQSQAALAGRVSYGASPKAAAAAALILNPPSFADLGVPPALVRVAASLHIERPTPIQILTLPRALRGGDLCGVAPTGTGKTLCYCWPLLQRIACGNGHAFLGLVLLPARELAVQVLEQFRIYGASLGTRVCVLLGGRDLTEEGKTLLQQAPHILIATPGRLADYVQNNLATMRERLSVVKVLVLDEADMLLSHEFKEDLKCILACLPPSSAGLSSSFHNAETTQGERSSPVEASRTETTQTSLRRTAGSKGAAATKDADGLQSSCSSGSDCSSACSVSNAGAWRIATGAAPRFCRQTLLFSATVSPAVLALQQQRFGDALMPLFDATAAAAAAAAHPRIAAGHSELPETGVRELPPQQQVLLPRLSHYYLFVPTAMRFAYLLYLLEHVPPYDRDRGIIFAGSVRQAQRLCTALEVLKQQVTPLHSIMKQRTRIACLEKFRSEMARLLVCTDIAGRGLDLPRVEFVICLDVPPEPQVYVHRTGRTARAGRKGVALTFVEPSAVRAVHRIEAYINTRLQPLPSFNEHAVVQQLNYYSRVLQKAALFLNEIGFDEKADQHEAYTKASKELRRRKKDASPLLV